MASERIFGEPHSFVRPPIESWPVIQDDQALLVAATASAAAGEMLYNAFHTTYDHFIKKDQSDYTPFDQQAEKIARGIIKAADPDAIIMGEEISPNEDVSERDFWVVDGIDGTTNFALRIPFTNFTIAKVVGGKVRLGVVYDFLHENFYYARDGRGAYRNGQLQRVRNIPFERSVISFAPLRNVRRGKGEYERELVDTIWEGMREITEQSGRFHREFQSGGLELASIAAGKLDGFASSWTSPWDLSAGVLLVRESGGIATNMLGEEWQPSYWGVIAGTKEVHPRMLEILQPIFLRQFSDRPEYPLFLQRN